MTDLTIRTRSALGKPLLERLQTLSFCIVGCGGTGACFAEMLVRTGALRLALIDGDKVEGGDLNRIPCFVADDVGKFKVDVLSNRLQAIRQDLSIESFPAHFRRREAICSDKRGIEGMSEIMLRARDAVHAADIVFIGTDTNSSRKAIQDLLQTCPKEKRRHLAAGVYIDGDCGEYAFEASWGLPTPDEKLDDEGYGPANASYAAIVQEASAVAFHMLLNNLRDPKSTFDYYQKRYDSGFKPAEGIVNVKSSSSTQQS